MTKEMFEDSDRGSRAMQDAIVNKIAGSYAVAVASDETERWFASPIYGIPSESGMTWREKSERFLDRIESGDAASAAILADLIEGIPDRRQAALMCLRRSLIESWDYLSQGDKLAEYDRVTALWKESRK